eukprot:scaffold4879_cov354-Prasinococcus_capsulatus_cf.AAC.11
MSRILRLRQERAGCSDATEPPTSTQWQLGALLAAGSCRGAGATPGAAESCRPHLVQQRAI